MSRQLERDLEARAASRRVQLAHAVDFGLQEAVESDGLVFLGFAYQHRETDALLVIKAKGENGSVVAFVGAGCLGDAILKAGKLARRDKLPWKADEWAGK